MLAVDALTAAADSFAICYVARLNNLGISMVTVATLHVHLTFLILNQAL